MTVLVDTDVLVGFINPSEARHAEAVDIIGRVVDGAWGAPAVTDFVLDEALTLLMARGAPLRSVDGVLALVVEPVARGTPAALPLTRVSDTALAQAIPLFRRHFRRGLSFTDCTSLAVMSERGVEHVASFDRGFDGLVARVGA